MNVRIVYGYNSYHEEFLYHWQVLKPYIVRKWYGKKEVREDWETICSYDDFYMAKEAMMQYIAGERH